MKRIAPVRKLNLKTETLKSLQAVQLDGVNGGITPAIFVASVEYCAAVSALALGSAQRSCLTCRCR